MICFDSIILFLYLLPLHFHASVQSFSQRHYQHQPIWHLSVEQDEHLAMGKEPQRARKSAVNPYPAPGDGRSTEPGPSQRPTSGVADNLESMGIDTADAIFIDGANDDPDDPRTIAQAMLRAAEKRAGIIPDDSARNDREDKEVCEKVDEIKQLILKLADSFPQTVGKPSDLILERLMKPENESLIRHIGWNALAGKNGENDWEDLLSSAVNRKALVFAILGTGLKGNVFSETFFGASPGISESLKNIDKEYRNSEGNDVCLEPASCESDISCPQVFTAR